jgi:hypothetical protein
MSVACSGPKYRESNDAGLYSDISRTSPGTKNVILERVGLQSAATCIAGEGSAISQPDPVHLDACCINGYPVSGDAYQALEDFSHYTVSHVEITSVFCHLEYWKGWDIGKDEIASLRTLVGHEVQSHREAAGTVYPQSCLDGGPSQSERDQ